MKKNETISVRVPERLKRAVERMAEEDSRSMASLVEKILTAYVKSKGYLK